MKAGDGLNAPAPIDDEPKQGRKRLKTIVLYGGMVVLGFFVIQIVMHVGSGLHAPKPTGLTAAKKESGQNTEDIVWRLLLASAVIIIVARLVGAAFQTFHQLPLV